MTLQQFLSTLQTATATVEIYDGTTLVISMLAGGYGALEDTIEARTVLQWSLIAPQKIKVVLAE